MCTTYALMCTTYVLMCTSPTYVLMCTMYALMRSPKGLHSSTSCGHNSWGDWANGMLTSACTRMMLCSEADKCTASGITSAQVGYAHHIHCTRRGSKGLLPQGGCYLPRPKPQLQPTYLPSLASPYLPSLAPPYLPSLARPPIYPPLHAPLSTLPCMPP
jgi:hypothetical protein